MKPPAGPSELFTRALAAIEQRLGLHFPASRQAELLALLADSTSGMRPDEIAAWTDRLEHGEASDPVLQSLARRLTVGETYFFREPATLDVVENRILPELIRARAGGSRRLRLWSAGCCTGEEPYTLAMILERLLPDIDHWNILILATDINRDFLARAVEGVYTEWSFRQTRPDLKARFFRETAPGRHVLHPRVRARVTFTPLNLATDTYPSATHDTGNMDLILCRNVLMYFSERQAQGVMTRLHRSLLPGGWLAVSPTEHALRRTPGFRSTCIDGAFLYRKINDNDTPAPAPRAAVSPPAPAPRRRSATPSPRPSALPASPAPAVPLRAAPPTPALSLAQRARHAADAGRLVEALQICDDALATDKMNPALHGLRARILEELGRADEAGDALRRVLYLDPDSIPAHFALGNLALRQHKPAQSRRSFAQVLALLRTLPPEAELPDMDGMTAGHLAEMIRLLARSVA